MSLAQLLVNDIIQRLYQEPRRERVWDRKKWQHQRQYESNS